MSRQNPSGSLPPAHQVEVIDLTLSPSPPPSIPRPRNPAPRESRRRHTPYDARDHRRRPALPRPNAEVIDLDELPDLEPGRHADNREHRRTFFSPPGSDIEVTIAHARVRPPPGDPFDAPQRNDPPARPGAAPEQPFDDFLFAPYNPGPNDNLGGIANILNWVRGDFQLGFSSLNFGMLGAGHRQHAPVAPFRDHRPENFFAAAHFQPPGANLAYNERAHGFAPPEDEIQVVGQHHTEDKPIKDAREGFTRSPKSEQAIGCSRCDQELGDSDDDIKKQIWVMKCGHCYCGECANFMLSRPQPRAPKSKRGRRTYNYCEVEDCKQHAQGKKFIWEIYV